MTFLSKIYVAGHGGMVGSAIVRHLLSKNTPLNCILTRTRSELELTDQLAVRSFFEKEQPDEVYLAAAKVGGIYANNTYPAEFIYSNLMVQANLIDAAFKNGVKKLLFLGSSCIYPRLAEQPITEDKLLTGILEPTNEPYAIAKISGIKLCESYNRQYAESHGVDYRCIMPTNLYGPGDNYHPENSHVIPALIKRFHDVKINKQPYIMVWGSGNPKREFVYVDDMAAAAVHIMNIDKKDYLKYSQPRLSHINIGSGIEVTIKELSILIAKVVEYSGEIRFDHEKPDGVPSKLLDSSRAKMLGWNSKIRLEEGLALAYNDFLRRYG
jgi:GDP-L-fucose synthase